MSPPLAHVCNRHRRILPLGETCPECAAQTSRRRETARDPVHRKVMDSNRWQRARAAARRRDGGCLRRHEGGCRGRIEVHHVVKPRDGGDPYGLGNLRTLCRRHHGLEEGEE